MVHLPQPAFRVFAVRRHDADVVDALAAARANVEAETRHQSSLQIARIAFFRALSPRRHGARASGVAIIRSPLAMQISYREPLCAIHQAACGGPFFKGVSPDGDARVCLIAAN